MRALLWGALCFGALRAGARSGAAALCARQGRRAPESASPPPQKAGRAERLQPPRAPGALFFKQCKSHPFAKGAASVPPGTCRAFARFHPAGKLHHQLFVRFLFGRGELGGARVLRFQALLHLGQAGARRDELADDDVLLQAH